MNIKKLEEAANNFGTPLYVYDLSIIENQYRKLQNAFKNLNNYKVHFASKSLSNISILKFIKNLGLGLDAVSLEEIKTGIKCGFNKDEILYTPNGVDFSEIQKAKSLGVKINLDSLESITEFSKHYPNQSISIRINPGIYAGGNDNISVGHSNSKFGIPEEFLEDLIMMDEESKIKVTGLHIHTGSDIIKNNQFDEGIKKIFSIATKFKRIESVDLGGGIKIPYFSGDTETNLEDYASIIEMEYKKFKNKTGKELKLIFEPGKFLVSDSGYFITKVNYIKKSNNNCFAQVNSGFNHFIRPTFYKSYHEVVNLSNPSDQEEDYTIVGYICEKDTFAEKRKVSRISKDDILCFKNAGAYGYNMSSNYNSRLRPAEVCIHNGELKKIRQEEQLEDLFKNQIDIFQ